MLHTLAGIGALLAALVGRWLLLDDDAPADTPCYPVGQYRPCRPGDCGEWRFGPGPHQRVLLTRRVPLRHLRTLPN